MQRCDFLQLENIRSKMRANCPRSQRMAQEQTPKPKTQSSRPPPRPPRGPTVGTAFGDSDGPRKKKVILPAKPSAPPKFKLP